MNDTDSSNTTPLESTGYVRYVVGNKAASDMAQYDNITDAINKYHDNCDATAKQQEASKRITLSDLDYFSLLESASKFNYVAIVFFDKHSNEVDREVILGDI